MDLFRFRVRAPTPDPDVNGIRALRSTQERQQHSGIGHTHLMRSSSPAPLSMRQRNTISIGLLELFEESAKSGLLGPSQLREVLKRAGISVSVGRDGVPIEPGNDYVPLVADLSFADISGGGGCHFDCAGVNGSACHNVRFSGAVGSRCKCTTLPESSSQNTGG